MSDIKTNTARLLQHFGVEGVYLTQFENDRAFGWDTEGRLIDYVIAMKWIPCPSFLASISHGTMVSFREPGDVRPAMQVCFHAVDPARRAGPRHTFVEIDLDYASPNSAKGFWRHAGEVVGNLVTGKKTDQNKIAEMLTKRGVA